LYRLCQLLLLAVKRKSRRLHAQPACNLRYVRATFEDCTLSTRATFSFRATFGTFLQPSNELAPRATFACVQRPIECPSNPSLHWPVLPKSSIDHSMESKPGVVSRLRIRCRLHRAGPEVSGTLSKTATYCHLLPFRRRRIVTLVSTAAFHSCPKSVCRPAWATG
jgi:hypothetical protein